MLAGIAPRGTLAAIDDGDFESEDFGFRIEWDTDVWTGQEADLPEGVVGVTLDSITTWGQIQAAGYQVDDAEECLADLVEPFADDDGGEIEDFGIAPVRVDRFESLPGSESELFTYVFPGSNGRPLDLVMFASCTPILDGEAALEIFLTTTTDVYEDVMVEWEDLVAGITLDEAASDEKPSKHRNDDRNRGDDSKRASGETLTTPNYGVEVEYDDAIWTPEDLSDDEIDLVAFESEYGRAQVIAIAAEPDLTGCLDSLVSAEEQYAADGIDVAPSRYDRPDTVRRAEAELYTYEFESESGPVDVFVYFECRELGSGDGMVAVTFTTFGDAYEDALPVLEEFLAGVDG